MLALIAQPAAAAQLAQAATTATRIGAAAAVRGLVQLAAVPGVRVVGQQVASGEPIYLGDKVTTGDGGRLQVLLLDETVFTIGPNAVLVIDEFVYDPGRGQGKVAASVLKGAFRFITGKVARNNPSDMEVRLPVGSIGIRGTSVAGETDGVRAMVVLLGPGPDSNTDERTGRIFVSGTVPGGGTPVEISRPGYATEIPGAGQPPNEPIRLDPARLNALTAPLSGTAPDGPPASPDSDASQPAGESPATTGAPAPQETGPALDGTQALQFTGASLAGGLEGIDNVGELQPLLDTAAMIAEQASQTPPTFSTTTYEELRAITSGTAVFALQTMSMSGTPGAVATYTFHYSYDFGSRSANGSVTIDAIAGFAQLGSANFPLLFSQFDTATGPVVIDETDITVTPLGGSASVHYEFVNNNANVLSAVKHKVNYDDGTASVDGQGISTR
jgi:hypothetical protein